MCAGANQWVTTVLAARLSGMQLKDIQVAGVAAEDRIRLGARIQLVEQLDLQILLLVDALDDEIGIPRRFLDAEAIRDARLDGGDLCFFTTSFLTSVSRLA